LEKLSERLRAVWKYLAVPGENGKRPHESFQRKRFAPRRYIVFIVNYYYRVSCVRICVIVLYCKRLCSNGNNNMRWWWNQNSSFRTAIRDTAAPIIYVYLRDSIAIVSRLPYFPICVFFSFSFLYLLFSIQWVSEYYGACIFFVRRNGATDDWQLLAWPVFLVWLYTFAPTSRVYYKYVYIVIYVRTVRHLSNENYIYK